MPARLPACPLAAALALACLLASAQEPAPVPQTPGEAQPQAPAASPPAQTPAEGELPPEVPRPAFMDRKPYIPDFLLRRKKEGLNLNPIPAIGYDAEQGFTIGVLGEMFHNGSRDDPFFRTAPYRWKLAGAATFSTENVNRFRAFFDQPYMFGGPYRLRAAFDYERNDLANYFGVGEDSMRKLHFPGSPSSFTRFEDYEEALQRESGGQAFTRYNDWKSRYALGGAVLERDLFGGLIRPLVGFQLKHTRVDDYTGESVDAEDASGQDVDAIQAPTKLFEDDQAGIIEGFDGGWDNFLKLGLSFDTRDFEPDPQTGVLAQVTGEISTRYLGSSFDYQRVTLSVSGYQDVLPGTGSLVFAARVLYSMQFGSVPFFSLDTLSFNEKDREGLGGFASLRGFHQDRFIGDSAVLVNAELRWTLTEWHFWNQNLRPMLAPFVDSGRVFDGRALKFEGWKVGYGVGIRLAWNLATVVSFDYGRSEEEEVFYMELGHQF